MKMKFFFKYKNIGKCPHTTRQKNMSVSTLPSKTPTLVSNWSITWSQTKTSNLNHALGAILLTVAATSVLTGFEAQTTKHTVHGNSSKSTPTGNTFQARSVRKALPNLSSRHGKRVLLTQR